MVSIYSPSIVHGLRATSLLTAGLFAGGALYISLVDVPSRAKRPAVQSRKEFKVSVAGIFKVFGIV